MILIIPEGEQFDPASAPDHVLFWRIVERRFDRIEVQSSDPEALQRWAASRGYYTPESVRSEQLWIALYQTDLAVFAAVEQMVESSTPIRLATRAAIVRRVSQTVAGLRDALQASGFDYVDDAWLDRLWQAAIQIET
jgi:hypothetical protein